MNPVARLLLNKQTSYRLTLGSDSGKPALADLRKFCNATQSNFSTDALEMARMEGRREVFTRICNYLNIDFNEVYNLDEEYDDE